MSIIGREFFYNRSMGHNLEGRKVVVLNEPVFCSHAESFLVIVESVDNGALRCVDVDYLSSKAEGVKV